MIGKTILHYKILEKIGEGGMGVVYKAEDTKLERTVAIKFLPRQITANSEEHERFQVEAKAAAQLNHPNIATIHAIKEVDDEIFIVMEYIEGQELHDIVGATGPVAPEIADRIRELVTEYGGDRVLMNFYHLLLAELHLDKGDGGVALSQLVQLSGWMANHYPNSVTLMARAKALTGNTKSAIEIYERLYNNTTAMKNQSGGDYIDYFLERPKVNYYLAQLYEKRGEVEQARKYYSTFLDLWKDADPDLPELIDAKERLARLTPLDNRGATTGKR